MKHSDRRPRGLAGAVGFGLLAFFVTFFGLYASYIYAMMYLNDHGYLPRGELTGWEAAMGPILGLGMPAVLFALAVVVGFRVDDATVGGGWLDSSLAIVIGTILLGAVAAVILVIVFIYAIIWVAFFIFGGLVVITALGASNN